MLKLIETEIWKLRRKKLLWLMLPAAFVMPAFALFYFQYLGKTGAAAVQFYKWSAFSYTPLVILPVLLGVLASMLFYEENQNDVAKQLWIIPVDKPGYFFAKFFMVLLYSLCFMLLCAIASVLFCALCVYVDFDWESVLLLLKICLGIGILSPFAMLPILAVAAVSKGYILPACLTFVYTFSGFLLMNVNMCVHPLGAMSVILLCSGDIPGVLINQPVSIPLALFGIGIWDTAFLLLAAIGMNRNE